LDDLVDRPARELRALIGRKAISPVELFEACRARIERVDPKVNALVADDFERARRDAETAEAAVLKGERLGLLHGLPVAIKDLMATEGLKTTYGSLIHRDNVPERDEIAVARLRQAGAIVIGKTNTPEFGAGSNTTNRVYGATVNPFDPILSCAGSSGGAAAALATGMVPLATGSDMGGSLRTPASFCGVVGHRTSPGAVPNDVRGYGWSPLSVDGPMARTVGDTALLMAALVGADDRDPLAQPLSPDPFANLAAVDLGSLRVAFSADLGCAPVSAAIRAHFKQCAGQLAPLFAHTEWREPDFGDAHFTFETLRAIAFADVHSDYVAEHRRHAGPNVIANAESAKSVSVRDIGRAHREQTDLLRRFQRFFAEFDVLICPAASVVPFPVEDTTVAEIDGEAMATYITWIAVTYAITLSTHPATVIPCGLGPSGMPFGLQIVGRNRDDAGTLAVAAALEAALAEDPRYRRPVPDLDALTAPGTASLAGTVPAALEAHAQNAGIRPGRGGLGWDR
jgi:Asp-tRNA(Asn)/Glu-tRNA(Gln) amidotransferase A subunit family amidase